jgi:hypothetical protein
MNWELEVELGLKRGYRGDEQIVMELAGIPSWL